MILLLFFLVYWIMDIFRVYFIGASSYALGGENNDLCQISKSPSIIFTKQEIDYWSIPMSESENYSEKGKRKPVNPIILAILVVVLITLSIKVVPSLLVLDTKNPTPTRTSISTRAFTPTKTSHSTSARTPTPTPTWEIIISLPPEFKVGPWHDEKLDCGVRIMGVEIVGGVPPYEITFIQNAQVETRKSPRDGRVEFRNPVTVKKDKPIFVSVSYRANNEEVRWEGKLLYPFEFFNPRCPIDSLSSDTLTPTQIKDTLTMTAIILKETPTLPVVPNLTLTLQAIDDQLQNSLKSSVAIKSSIAFNKPSQMELGQTASIELLVNPSMSEADLATQLVELSGLVTSTAGPTLIAPSGEISSIVTDRINITPRMKAVLKSEDPDAFFIEKMHDGDDQAISGLETTKWRWTVTAKKEGSKKLELIISRLLEVDGKEQWREVETYIADIDVEVNPIEKLWDLDWKWIASVILIPLVGVIWGWWLNRKKKSRTAKARKKKQ
jgi:hypothetical protein